ncbi:MAG TPA: hypothetical protein VFT60_06625, partial [Bryobacteraceae bacterium]|nr:hypothetical protein [Bryobacteraceae bacterium]
MSRRFLAIIAGALCAGALVWGAQDAVQDPIFEAMKSELGRSMTLSLKQLEKPYYISYAIETGHQWGATAVQGGLLGVTSQPFRYPQLQLRVGDYKFDQTNFVRGGRGPSYPLTGFPLDNSPDVIRQYLWLETDAAYKASLDAIARKRAALRSVTVSDELPDFDPAKPNTIL